MLSGTCKGWEGWAATPLIRVGGLDDDPQPRTRPCGRPCQPGPARRIGRPWPKDGPYRPHASGPSWHAIFPWDAASQPHLRIFAARQLEWGPFDAGAQRRASTLRSGQAISESETPSRNASCAVTKSTSPWWPQTSMDRRLVITGRPISMSMYIKQRARLFWPFPAGECHQNQLADATSFMLRAPSPPNPLSTASSLARDTLPGCGKGVTPPSP